MARIVKPTLSNVSVNNQVKIYNYQGEIKKTNAGDINQSSIYDNYSNKGEISSMYMQTGAVNSKGFISRAFNYISRTIKIKFNNAIQEIKGKIESFLSKFKVEYTTSENDNSQNNTESNQKENNQDNTEPHQNVEREQAKEKEEKQKPKEDPKPKEEPKKEETPKEEQKPKEEETPVTKPGQNAQLTNELDRRKNELKVGDGVSNRVRIDCNSYSVGGQNDNHYPKDGQLSAKEKEMLIYLAYHEASADPVQATAVISSYLNGWERSGYSFNKYMATACSQWSVGDDFKAATQSYQNGTYTLNDVKSMNKYKELQSYGYYDQLNDCVDNVLAGTRNTNSTQWHGNGLINTYTHPIN